MPGSGFKSVMLKAGVSGCILLESKVCVEGEGAGGVSGTVQA